MVELITVKMDEIGKSGYTAAIGIFKNLQALLLRGLRYSDYSLKTEVRA